VNERPVTEARNAASADLELRSTAELVELMNREDAVVPAAVADALDEIAAVVDEVVAQLLRGGRLLYAGAGTSGRLAELDAAECDATFGTPPGQVVAVVAGAGAGSTREREAAEDDEAAGARALHALRAGPDDAVVVVSASGRTPFALGAARTSAAAGAFTACVVCVPDSELADVCAREIAVLVGPEILAGSTRLKAGTAQKLVLNTISTVSMIRLGRTYGGLMVGVVPANEKLRGRVRDIVRDATGAPEEEVNAALAAAGGEAKVAIMALLTGVDATAARTRLEATGGNLSEALVP
jgi:N-acetylmuramic acid 6-phosphate etherase